MNAQQKKDAAECEMMAEQGKNKDCLGCSCNINICAADNDSDLEFVLNRTHEMLMEYAVACIKGSESNSDYYEGAAVGLMLAWHAAALRVNEKVALEGLQEYRVMLGVD